jgi:hypothetical protein
VQHQSVSPISQLELANQQAFPKLRRPLAAATLTFPETRAVERRKIRLLTERFNY